VFPALADSTALVSCQGRCRSASSPDTVARGRARRYGQVPAGVHVPGLHTLLRMQNVLSSQASPLLLQKQPPKVCSQQFPWLHVPNNGASVRQALAHLPQLALSARRSTQVPLQFVRPVGQPQLVPLHTPPTGQVTQVPPHSVIPLGHVHARFWQVLPSAQTFVHDPQLAASVVRSTQIWPQISWVQVGSCCLQPGPHW
jgi:hypothetical protein